MHILPEILEAASGTGAIAGIAYSLICLWSAHRFLWDRAVVSQPVERAILPPVSILKPLKGEDPEIFESFRSHCVQEYPEYELIFGVSDLDDPAVHAVERLRQEFPMRAIQLVVCSETLGPNAKVSNLVRMLAAARYDHLIVSDSDIRVEPDYLRKVTAPLSDTRIGMVTCLYRGIAGPTLGSRLESLGISTDFCAGVLVARLLEGGVRFGLGSTMAFRRSDLKAMGGFESLTDHLADDYELGKRIAELGREVRYRKWSLRPSCLPTACAGSSSTSFAGPVAFAIPVQRAISGCYSRSACHGLCLQSWLPAEQRGRGASPAWLYWRAAWWLGS